MTEGTIMISGADSAQIEFPRKYTLESIQVTAAPGVPGSTSPNQDVILWNQRLRGKRSWWNWFEQDRRMWIVTLSWDVSIPYEVSYVIV
jgi:hypothetical protein